MTPREAALLLRLAACEVRTEPRSAVVLRRILRDLGWSDAALDAAVARLRQALAGVGYVQMTMDEAA